MPYDMVQHEKYIKHAHQVLHISMLVTTSLVNPFKYSHLMITSPLFYLNPCFLTAALRAFFYLANYTYSCIDSG